MRKVDEKVRPDSCFNKADETEMLFVLLGRDKAAPSAIRHWIRERLRLKLNDPGDPKLVEAEACARTIEVEQC